MSGSPPRPTPAGDPHVGLPHLPALDGLRGVAVALVVGYHLAPGAVPGGFLGVDVFFVLSGFLITSLVIDEVRAREGFSAGSFYLRRIKRLLPALLLVVLAMSLYALVWAEPQELDRLRDHGLWTLGYLANWRYIADGTTYTDVVYGASPLRHTWSLAIEEQFYILFPILVLAIGWALRWRAEPLRRAIGAVALVGALASATWMAVLWGDGSNPSRGYFGTDTRVHALLVGVLLGALLVGRPMTGSSRGGRYVAGAALVGAVGLGLATAIAHEDSAGLQRGGFLFVAVATAAVIAGVERVRPLHWTLTRRPVVALGLISYGVYLWHWPILVVFDEVRTGLDGVALAGLRLGLTLAAALASYWLVEQPIRRGRVPSTRRRPAFALSAASVLTAGCVVIAATVVPAPSSIGPRPTTSVPPEVADRLDLPLGMLVFGDSVAESLAGGDRSGFGTWRPEDSPYDPGLVQIWSMARLFCSYLAGSLVLNDGTLNDPTMLCSDWKDELTRRLDEGEADDVVLVALSNDAGDRIVDGERVALGSPQHQALLDDFLDELRAASVDRGARVVLVALPPRAEGRGELDVGGRRERIMRDELNAYAQDRPDVLVLDLFEQVCPDGDCDHPVDGFEREWRPDGWHYSPEGARWVADWVTAQLLDLDGATPQPEVASGDTG